MNLFKCMCSNNEGTTTTIKIRSNCLSRPVNINLDDEQLHDLLNYLMNKRKEKEKSKVDLV